MLRLLAVLFACLPAAAWAQAPTADELLDRSIAHHDPEGRWKAVEHAMTLRETRPDREDQTTYVVVDWGRDVFEVDRGTENGRMRGRLEGANCEAEGPRILCGEREGNRRPVGYWRDYYGYLLSLPMNLRDAGTNLNPTPERTTFDGEEVWALQVTYDAEVGQDTWYLYLDPETHALVGAHFYHDEAANDGEYIVFDDEIAADGLRLPKERRWYMNADDRYLGTDIIEAYEVR